MFEKINKIDKLLARLMKKKRKKAQRNKIRCLQNSGNHREPSKNLGSVTVGPQARLGTGRGLGNKVNWDRDRQSQEGRWNKFKISWESCNLTLE